MCKPISNKGEDGIGALQGYLGCEDGGHEVLGQAASAQRLVQNILRVTQRVK